MRKTTAGVNRYIHQLSGASRQLTAVNMRNDMEGQNGNGIKFETVRRRLHKMDLFGRLIKKPFA